MSHPESESAYLARMVPSSVAGTAFTRRTALRAVGGAGLGVSAAAALAACGGSSTSTSSSSTAATGTVTFGSNQSDAQPKKVLQTILDAAATAKGITVKVNTVDHNTFQENISTYLQGKPDDVFNWFSGYRLRYFAEKNLVGDISDVWSSISGYSDGFKSAATGTDGKQYLVPSSYYPWALFYRKSVFKKYGYTVPTTLDELTALSKQMQKDGLVPIAFADKDGWPAMGTFDILNLRVNGYQFHVDLMAGQKAWNSTEVKNVFDLWAQLLPYHQSSSLGRTWEEAAQSLLNKKAGMYLLGLFVSQQFTKQEDLDDLDFFTFPEVDSAIGADTLDAPIDGYMLAKRPKNEGAAKALLSYLGSADAANVQAKADPTTLVANGAADTSAYTALQKKAAEIVGAAKNIAQFLDRDTRPDFASTVMIPSLQSFIKDPTKVSSILDDIEAQKKSIFTS